METVGEALAGGVDCVQLRERDLSARQLLDLARPLRELTHRHRAALIVNDRLDVALAAGADGVHLGFRSLTVAEARPHVPEGFLIGASTHSPEEGTAAQEAGADYVTFGPVYATPSKRPWLEPRGPAGLRRFKGSISIPTIAIGGIDRSRVPEVMAAGASGVGVIRALGTSPEVTAEAQALARLVRSCGPEQEDRSP